MAGRTCYDVQIWLSGESRLSGQSATVRFPMLRAGLFGFPSAGKTALFQLLTSAREAPRQGGKADANVGVSRVPDERLDRLTALFKPRKHVPATVEFADVAGTAGAQTGAKALLDLASHPWPWHRPPPPRWMRLRVILECVTFGKDSRAERWVRGDLSTDPKEGCFGIVSAKHV